MINHELKDLFKQSSVHKKFVIDYDGGTITNSDMFMEEFSLEESLCSEEELRFGCCEASVVRFPISNTFTSLNGKVLDVSVVLDHNEDKPLKIGKYKVASDIPTADRKRKDITAYDALFDVINANVADWYNALLSNADSTVTLKQFRDSFFGYFGIEQVNKSLVNDNMVVTKTIQPTELSGSVVANAICELNGCFGHINRDGLMDYVFLEKSWSSLYPADDLYPANNLFPREGKTHKYSSSDYTSGGCDYQDYVVQKVTGIEIRQEGNSVCAFVGTKENPYVVSDNFLTYGKSTEEMTGIAQNMFSVIKDIEYRPFTLDTFRGNPCVEVGDGITIYTDNQIIESYVLNRTLTGIQALSDSFDTRGRKYRTAQVNSVQSQITQLKGKSNILERTIEATRSEIRDIEKGLGSEIEQLTDSVAVKIDKNGNVVSGLTLDKNGMTFVGNYLVIDTQNFKLDEEGNAELLGEVIAKEGLSIYSTYLKDFFKLIEFTFESADDATIRFKDHYGDDFMTISSAAGNAFQGNISGTANYANTLLGNATCTDRTKRIPVGTSNSGNYDIAYINSKAQNENGAYLITVNGKWESDLFASHNIVSASSDIRLKENIKPTKIKNALDIVNKLGLYEFDWKENGAHQEIGFIADYLQEVDKRLAVGGGYEEDGAPNYKTVDSFYMQGYLVKAIQELSQENKELRTEIGELKKSVSFLMEKLGGMVNE